MFRAAVIDFLRQNNYSCLHPKVVLFDMDGVLFDSMPYHAKAWVHAMNTVGLPFSEYKAYLNEGRTGASTIDNEFTKVFGRYSTEEEKQHIYKLKTDHFETFPQASSIDCALELAEEIKLAGLKCSVVTGSGQRSLIENIEIHYPNVFDHEHMVTAYDVKQGKPFPEPYLMGLHKHGVSPNEAIVIENAPLGIQSGVAAGVFTIAVNTGILEDKVLHEAGAHLVFSSMKDLQLAWKDLLHEMHLAKL